VCEGWWGWEGTILDEEDKIPVGFEMRGVAVSREGSDASSSWIGVGLKLKLKLVDIGGRISKAGYTAFYLVKVT
jgi:hypothetical protein